MKKITATKITTTVSEELHTLAKKHKLKWNECLARGIVAYARRDADLIAKIEHLEENIAKFQRIIRRMGEIVYVLQNKDKKKEAKQ